MSWQLYDKEAIMWRSGGKYIPNRKTNPKAPRKGEKIWHNQRPEKRDVPGVLWIGDYVKRDEKVYLIVIVSEIISFML